MLLLTPSDLQFEKTSGTLKNELATTRVRVGSMTEVATGKDARIKDLEEKVRRRVYDNVASLLLKKNNPCRLSRRSSLIPRRARRSSR